MQKLAILIGIAALTVAWAEFCNICHPSGYACDSETTYRVCTGGRMLGKSIPCEYGLNCTDHPQICAIGRPACTYKCGKCNEERTIACMGPRRFSLCHGKLAPSSRIYECPGDTVCNNYLEGDFCAAATPGYREAVCREDVAPPPPTSPPPPQHMPHMPPSHMGGPQHSHHQSQMPQPPSHHMPHQGSPSYPMPSHQQPSHQMPPMQSHQPSHHQHQSHQPSSFQPPSQPSHQSPHQSPQQPSHQPSHQSPHQPSHQSPLLPSHQSHHQPSQQQPYQPSHQSPHQPSHQSPHQSHQGPHQQLPPSHQQPSHQQPSHQQPPQQQPSHQQQPQQHHQMPMHTTPAPTQPTTSGYQTTFSYQPQPQAPPAPPAPTTPAPGPLTPQQNCAHRGRPGRYPVDSSMCRSYLYCYVTGGALTGQELKCPGTTVFNPDIQKCVAADTYTCVGGGGGGGAPVGNQFL